MIDTLAALGNGVGGPMMTRQLTLKDMMDGSGCTARTVRHYEREGLLSATRSSGGHRMFGAGQLERLRFIIVLREAGWALDEINELFDVRHRGAADQVALGRLDHLLVAHVERLERKIATLTALREDLARSHALVPVCQQCTDGGAVQTSCEACDRLPPLAELPRSFRLVWRAREIAAGRLFDEAGGDGDDEAAQ